jgi:hypothetical protein
MSTDFFLEIKDLISDEFGETCSVATIDDSETRFSLSVNFIDFSLVIVGTDARVCLRVKFSTCEKYVRKILIFAVCESDTDTREQLRPYIFSTWKNSNKNYQNIPSSETLINNEEAYLEICTTPCDITSEVMAQEEIKGLLLKSMEWITSYQGDTEDGALEGNKQLYSQTKIERSIANRNRCIEIFGTQCQVCEIKLSEIYGELAEDFIHVHHVESIAKTGPRWIDPSKDLIPVCPNCHSMLHRRDPPIMPNDLRKILELKIRE